MTELSGQTRREPLAIIGKASGDAQRQLTRLHQKAQAA